VPADIGFATKPQLARRMVERAMASGVLFAWVAADTVYGASELEMALRHAGKGYVLGMPRTQGVWSSGTRPDVSGTAEDAAATLEPAAWQRLSAGAGDPGPRVYDWAYVELGDLDAPAQGYAGSHGLWTRGLLARRSIADGVCAFFATWCPAGTGIGTLVAVEGQRWAEAVKVPSALPVEYGWRGSRTASKPPRMSSASTTTKAAPGTASTATSRWSCRRSPCWQPSATTRTGRLLRKLRAAQLMCVKPYPLVAQEIRRVATRLAQQRIRPAHIIASSLWRRAHQAAAQRSHMKRNTQL